MSAEVVPPPGFGPVLARWRPSIGECRVAVASTIAGYAVLVLLFALARGFWWPILLIAAPFAALTLWFALSQGLAAGSDWLKNSGGGWVQTARLVSVNVEESTSASYLKLVDADRRKLDVRLESLTRNPAVWDTFYAALMRSVHDGLVLDDATGARIRATNARLHAG